MKTPALLALLGALATAAACTESNPFPPSDAATSDVPREAAARCNGTGAVVCAGNVAQSCNAAGEVTAIMDCGEQHCVAGMGCRACTPGSRRCNDTGAPEVCNAAGEAYEAQPACPAEQACSSGNCVSLCAEARTHNAYVGCDYWAVATLNSALGGISNNPFDPNTGPPVGVEGFPFAIAVANPQSVRATVTVEGGAIAAGSNVTGTVEPGQLQIIELPWVDATSQVTRAGAMRRAGVSALAVGGAYHVTSSVPVTVYQFNPLSFRDRRRPACDPTFELSCFSFTNDASLLLPTHVLTGHYTALAWPSSGTTNATRTAISSGGGFVAIVGTSETRTTVTIRLAGGVRAGGDIGEASAGETITQELGRGDVLELVSGAMPLAECMRDAQPMSPGGATYSCRPVREYDLTGSIIEADQPVAVFGGHNCANVPYNRSACDHLEEQLFPNETLGTHYVVSRTQSQLRMMEPNLVRVLSNRDGNVITFDPPTVHAPVMLDRGQYVDFEHREDFEVRGMGPFAVAQFLVGQNYFNDPFGSFDAVGDPSMVLEVPVEQYRSTYEFLAPDTYERSFLNVVAPRGTRLILDDAPLPATPTQVGMYDVYRVDISRRTGAHRIQSGAGRPFGIKVYGFGAFTSYMYPGGLDLQLISPPG